MFYAGHEQFQDFQELVSRSEPGTTLHLPEGVLELGAGVLVRSGLSLKGRGMGRTILRTDMFCFSFDGGHEDVWSLEDLTIDNSGSRHVTLHATRSGTLRLDRVEVKSGTVGLKFAGSVRAALDGCRVRGKFGIHGSGRAALNITRTEFQGCDQAALCLEDECSCQVHASRFHQNDMGAFVRGGGDCLVSGCRFTENRTAAVVVTGTSRIHLVENLCRGSLGPGISLQGLSRGSVRSNVCEDNSVGIEVLEQAAPELLDNRLVRNRYCGLLYQGISGGAARLTECDGNGRWGIRVEEDATPLLSENRCTGSDTGILVLHRAEPQIFGNECSGNSNGVLLEGGSCRVEDNDCHDNQQLGIGGLAGEGTLRNNRLEGNRVPLYLSFESRHVDAEGAAFAAAQRLPEPRAQFPSTEGPDLDVLASALEQVHRDRLEAALNDSAAMRRLIANLEHRSRSLRVETARALGSLGIAAAVALPSLLGLAVADPDEEVRGAAARALVSLCPDLDRAPLWSVRGDLSQRVRDGSLVAIEWCGLGRGPENWLVLVQFAGAPDPEVRRSAVEALVDDYFPTLRREAPERFSSLFDELERGSHAHPVKSTILACMDPDRLVFHLDDLLRQGTEKDVLPAMAMLEHLAPWRSDALDLLFLCLDRAALTPEAIAALLRLGC